MGEFLIQPIPTKKTAAEQLRESKRNWRTTRAYNTLFGTTATADWSEVFVTERVSDFFLDFRDSSSFSRAEPHSFPGSKRSSRRASIR